MAYSIWSRCEYIKSRNKMLFPVPRLPMATTMRCGLIIEGSNRFKSISVEPDGPSESICFLAYSLFARAKLEHAQSFCVLQIKLQPPYSWLMLGRVSDRYRQTRAAPVRQPPCNHAEQREEMIAQLGRALGKGDSTAARVQLRAVMASIGSRSSHSPPNGRALRRKAVLVATSYIPETDVHLPNCHCDADRMKEALITSRGYHERDIAVVQNADATRIRILAEMRALMAQSHMCDEVVFYYAGHGVQRKSLSASEQDGLDECILAHDLNVVRDKEIAAIVARCAAACSLVFIADCCTSGSITDAVEVDQMRGQGPQEPVRHHVAIAACRDGTDAAQDHRGRGHLTQFLTQQMRRGDGCVSLRALCNKRLGLQRTVVSRHSDDVRNHLFL